MVAAIAFQALQPGQSETQRTDFRSASERELIERARLGDRWALHTLFARHEKKLYSLALRYAGDRETAQDALQDSYLRVLLCLHQLKADARFGAWMTRIVINATRLRHRKARRFIALKGALDSGLHQHPGPDPERQVAAREVIDLVDGFLSSRSMNDHELFYARFVEGDTIKSISERTGLPIAVIKTRVHRARKYLSTYLKGKNAIEDIN